MLRFTSTLEELAIYSVANNFAAAGAVFQSIFTVVWAPTVYKWVSQNVDMALIDKIAMQALAAVCAIIALSGSLSWITDYFLPTQYGSVKYILLCLLIQPLFYTLSEITCVGISIQRKTIYTIWINLSAMLTNWVLSYLLVPTYGAAGAAFANSIAFTVFFFLRTEISARIWRRFPRVMMYLITTIFVLLAGTNAFIGACCAHDFKYIWLITLVLVMVISVRCKLLSVGKGMSGVK